MFDAEKNRSPLFAYSHCLAGGRLSEAVMELKNINKTAKTLMTKYQCLIFLRLCASAVLSGF
jgi:hypothetical protein